MTTGEIPLNLMSPAVTMVIVPMAKQALLPTQFGSAFEVATSVTVAVVGTVEGAVKRPFASIEPQAGLQVGNCGKLMPFVRSIVPWVTSHVTPLVVPMSFVTDALN